MSNIELEAFVDAELERNPLLARDDRDGEAEPEAIEVAATDLSTDRIDDSAARADMDVSHDEASPGERATGDDPGSEGAADAGGSVDWSRAGAGGSTSFDGDADALESALTRDKTLNEHLHDQLAVSGLSGGERRRCSLACRQPWPWKASRRLAATAFTIRPMPARRSVAPTR